MSLIFRQQELDQEIIVYVEILFHNNSKSLLGLYYLSSKLALRSLFQIHCSTSRSKDKINQSINQSIIHNKSINNYSQQIMEEEYDNFYETLTFCRDNGQFLVVNLLGEVAMEPTPGTVLMIDKREPFKLAPTEVTK